MTPNILNPQEFSIKIQSTLPAACMLSAIVCPALAYDPVIVPAGSGQTIQVLGGPLEILVRNAQTEGDFSAVISTNPPGGGRGPNVTHKDRSETFYVIDGDFTFFVAGKEIKGGPGSMVVNPKGVPHGFKNTGTTDGHLLMIYSPGGFEDFFQEAADKKLQPGPDLGALETKYGVFRQAPQLLLSAIKSRTSVLPRRTALGQ